MLPNSTVLSIFYHDKSYSLKNVMKIYQENLPGTSFLSTQQQTTSKFDRKKLLILGANPETVRLIEAAKNMGVVTIVTDYDPQAVGKRFADKRYDVDGMNVSALVALAKEERVDGVIVGVADRLIVPYQQVCAALKLPCYATPAQCAAFTDKLAFNQLCLKYGISPIPFFNLGFNFCEEDLLQLTFPLFIKPVDGNSGKGMSICNTLDEVGAAVEKAMAVSQSGRFLVERYMDCDDLFINFTFKDGKCLASAIADRHTTRVQGNVSRVCLGAVYPSKHVDLYFDTLHDKFCRLFQDLGVQNGTLMVSAFVENGTFHVYDPGFRLQGEAPDLPIHAVNGFDQKALLIEHALTGTMGEADISALNDCRFRGRYAATIWYLAKEGKIGRINGLTEAAADPAVFKVVQRLYEGDEITPQMVGTEAQVVARLYVLGNTREELAHKVRKFQNDVQVLNDQGLAMLLEGFDASLI